MDESKVRKLLLSLSASNALFAEILDERMQFHIESEQRQFELDKENMQKLEAVRKARNAAIHEVEQFRAINIDLFARNREKDAEIVRLKAILAANKIKYRSK